jgi:hypothetical protein
MIYLYFATMLLGVTSASVTRISGADGGPIRAAVGLAGIAALFFAFGLGFAKFEWYVPLLAILAAGIFSAALVNRSTWPAIYAVQPAVDLFVVCSAVYLFIA